MSIIGIDIGNSYTKAAMLENGVINSLLFNNSDRLNNTLITFKEKRLIGSESYNILKNNLDNSIYGFHNLIHNLYSNIDEDTQSFFNKNNSADCYLPVKKINDQELYLNYIYISYFNLLIKSLNKSLNDTFVLSTPSYFNMIDVKFIENSIKIITNNFLLVSEEYAIGLDYGFYKSYRNEFISDKTVLFVNIGDIYTNTFVCTFNNDGMKIQNNESLMIGGNNYTTVLFNHVNELIYKKYKKNLINYPKKKLIVMRECEKIKKTLSTLKSARISLECLFGDDDTFSENIDRQLFDKLSQDLTLEIINGINNCVKNVDNLENIELLGGGMRVYNLREAIQNNFNVDLNYTLNPEDCIARGCVIYGAINSPIIKNANYKIEKFIKDPIYFFINNANKSTKILNDYCVIPSQKKIEFNLKKKNKLIRFYNKDNSILSTYSIFYKKEDDSNTLEADNNTLEADNNKIKIKLLVEINATNQINITKNSSQVDLIQLYQPHDYDKSILINKLKEVDVIERKIDNFYDTINFLEEKYYNSLSYEYVKEEEEEEVKQLNHIFKSINNKIIEDIPIIEDYEIYFDYKNKIIDLYKKLEVT